MKHFTDRCRHGEDSYVGSFVHMNETYDVYTYEGQVPKGTHACIRYGNEGHEYMSPGPLKNLNYGPSDSVYSKARELIEDV